MEITPDHRVGGIFPTPCAAYKARLGLCEKKTRTEALVRTWSVVPPLLIAAEVEFIPPDGRDESQQTNEDPQIEVFIQNVFLGTRCSNFQRKEQRRWALSRHLNIKNSI